MCLIKKRLGKFSRTSDWELTKLRMEDSYSCKRIYWYHVTILCFEKYRSGVRLEFKTVNRVIIENIVKRGGDPGPR